MSRPRLLGAVLAGGASSRLGRDKALEILGGLTLVERVARILEAVCESVVIVSPEDRGFGRETIPDLREPCGPLGAIEAALDTAHRRASDGVLVVACDFPLLTATSAEALAAVMPDTGAAVAARNAQPGFHPLLAAYSVGCGAASTELLDAGERAAWKLFEAVGGVTVELPEDELLNVNDEAGLHAAEAALARRG